MHKLLLLVFSVTSTRSFEVVVLLMITLLFSISWKCVGKLSGGHQAPVMVLAVDDTDTADGNICVVTGSKDHYIKVGGSCHSSGEKLALVRLILTPALTLSSMTNIISKVMDIFALCVCVCVSVCVCVCVCVTVISCSHKQSP